MNEINKELAEANVEHPIQAEIPSTTGEAVGSVALTALKNNEQVIPLDSQAPRSWDLHKSGW